VAHEPKDSLRRDQFVGFGPTSKAEIRGNDRRGAEPPAAMDKHLEVPDETFGSISRRPFRHDRCPDRRDRSR